MTNSCVDTSKPAAEKHHTGVRLYTEGQFEAAARILREALCEEPCSELANNWGVAELACLRPDTAEQGFAQALALDANNAPAAANLGALLAKQGRAKEAIPLLQKAALLGTVEQRPSLESLLAGCRAQIAADALSQSRAALEKLSARISQPLAPQPHRAAAPRAPVYVGNNQALLCTTFDRMMYVETTDLLIAPRLLMQGEWEPEETALLQRLVKPGQVFVDVGANIGYYALLAATAGAARVYAFEAQRSSFELLGKNVIINWMTNIIHCEHLAVFSHGAELTFFMRKNYPGNSGIGETADEQLEKWFDRSEQVKVRAVSLDQYFADKPGKIDVLKVDVEGAEPAVFEGASRLLQQNPKMQVLCEWSPDQMRAAKQSPERLIETWRKHGFRAFSVHKNLAEVRLDSLLQSGYQNLLLQR